MSEFSGMSPAALNAQLEEYALHVGGQPYVSEEADCFTLSRTYVGRRGMGQSHANFTAMRHREADTEDLTDVTYQLHQGTTTLLHVLPPEVLDATEIDPTDIGADEQLCLEDCTTYTFSSVHETLEVTRIHTYTIDESIILAVPFMNGNAVFDSEISSAAEPIFTRTESGLTVVEYSAGDKTIIPTDNNDVFASLANQFEHETDKVEMCVDRMIGIFTLVKAGV